MSKRPGFTAELLMLCGQMRDQTITPADAQRLNTLLAENKAARQFYLRFMTLTAGLESQLADTVATPEDTASDNDVDLLLDLLRMEQEAHAELVHVAKPPRFKRLKKTSNDPSWSKLMDRSLLLYIAGQAMRTKPVKWLAAAAVVALCVLIAVQFIGPATTAPTTTPITDNTPPKPAAMTQSTPRGPTPGIQTVATLTATHNAQWGSTPAERALARGSALHPNTRLTLTAGFAEITTISGAIAILQAPATVELLNNSNAIRLHAGKLVGICETERSKGFVVKTDYGDIIDLGTEFGVEVRGSQVTTTVFTGEVLINTGGQEPQSLTTNQTATLNKVGDANRVVVQDRVAKGFTQRLPGAANAQTVELTRMDQLDFTNIVKAYDFTGSDSLASDGASLIIGGVTFTRHNWQDGKPFDGMTLIDSARINDEARKSRDNQASGAPTLNAVGNASDQANLNKLLDWWNISMGQDNASLTLSIAVPDGAYKVQLITGMINFRENELFDIDAGDLGSGNEVSLGSYSGGKGNYLITGTAIATGGTLDLKLFGTPGPGDGRPIVSGLIISTNKGGLE